ncbi:MAG: 5'-nucleotidase C-terminal domain-containing protein [Flavobacteriales bacterium]
MKKQSFYIISFIAISFFLVLNGCKTNQNYTAKSNTIKIDSTLSSLESTEAFIQPYKESLDAEMNEILVYSEKSMIKGTPESELGNFVADLSLKIITEKFPEANIDFCLLNNGGLRTSLPQGAITRGKIFELMPFDNELVIVSLTPEKAKNLIEYIYNVGGQPISGTKLNFTLSADSVFSQLNWHKTVNIITTDYLANGGDKMDFFLNPIKIETTQLKLRDAIIEHCIEEHKKGNKITSALDERIYFNK